MLIFFPSRGPGFILRAQIWAANFALGHGQFARFIVFPLRYAIFLVIFEVSISFLFLYNPAELKE
jgi:hypothetical protein